MGLSKQGSDGEWTPVEIQWFRIGAHSRLRFRSEPSRVSSGLITPVESSEKGPTAR